MSGVSRVKAEMTISDRFGNVGPFAVEHAMSQTLGVGPFTVQVATGVSEQSIIALGTHGLTTITALMITADQDISVTYGVAANNVPIVLNKNAVHLISGTSLTALSISNSSGVTANCVYMIAGS